jgi:hypothetical protein
MGMNDRIEPTKMIVSFVCPIDKKINNYCVHPQDVFHDDQGQYVDGEIHTVIAVSCDCGHTHEIRIA